MINPDGVAFGNYRTSFLGKDMNRMFMSEFEDDSYGAEWGRDAPKIDERLIPEVVAVRRLLHCL
jgi:murein tripeptide amidase MpaA